MLVHIATGLLNIIVYVGDHLKVWSVYGGWAIGVAAVLQFIKRKYEIDKAKGFSFLGLWQMDGPRIMAAIYAIVAGASAWLSQFISPSVSATGRLTMLITLGLAAHRFVVSPAGAKLSQKLAPYLQALQQLRTLEQGIVANAKLQPAPAAAPSPTNEETTSPVPGTVVSSSTEGH